MQIQSTDGSTHSITMEEALRIHHEMMKKTTPPAAISSGANLFTIGGRPISLTHTEMEMVADYWWEHHGKKSMENFFKSYQHKAAENIKKAIGYHTAPNNEPEIKLAIAHALEDGDSDLIAEVMFEAMEWQTAHSNLKSIDR